MKYNDRIYLKHIDQYATIVEIENDTYARVTLEEDDWTIRVEIKDIAPIRKDKLDLI